MALFLVKEFALRKGAIFSLLCPSFARVEGLHGKGTSATELSFFLCLLALLTTL